MKYINTNTELTSPLTLVANVDERSYSSLWRDAKGTVAAYVHESALPRSPLEVFKDLKIESRTVRLATPFTLVPQSEFHEAQVSRIAQLAFPMESIDHVYHAVDNGMAIVYLISQNLKSILVRDFSEYKIEHVFETLGTKLHEMDTCMLAHWTDQGLLIVAKNQGLRLANYYKITAVEDAIYYLLSAYKYADLDPHIQPLRMSGRIASESALFDKLAGFIRNIEWQNGGVQQPSDFTFEPHLFYHLM